jgi:hypothetical protein
MVIYPLPNPQEGRVSHRTAGLQTGLGLRQ